MIRYCPELSVTAERTFSISTLLAASTVTPGRTPPELSVTVPVIVDWATAFAGRRITTANVASHFAVRIWPPFLHSCRSALVAGKYPADALAPISVDLGILGDDKHAESLRETHDAAAPARAGPNLIAGLTLAVAPRFRRGGAAAIDPIVSLRGD
jgi:hypothetical protein